MTSDNPDGADNQQERPGFEQWVVGFVDGEGCFSISVVRNRGCRLGWQVQHEFSVTQGATSLAALELLREFFGCGTLIENRRHDNHHSSVWRFSVKRREDLLAVVVPFFEEHPLITAKAADFRLFATVLRSMQRGEHLDEGGMRRIAARTEQMNPACAVSLPGILRGHTPTDSVRHRVEDMVLASWRHGGSLERNSLSGKFRPARMA